DLTQENHVDRELILMRVNAEPQHRAEVLRIADIFRAKVIDVTPMTLTLEVTGDESKLDAIIELLRPIGIQELVRTGKVAIARASKTTRRRAEERLGNPPDGASRRRREDDPSRDPRVSGFVD